MYSVAIVSCGEVCVCGICAVCGVFVYVFVFVLCLFRVLFRFSKREIPTQNRDSVRKR